MSVRSLVVGLLAVVFAGSLVLAPVAYAGLGDGSVIEKVPDPVDPKKVWFKVQNNESMKITDFHVRVNGAQVMEYSSPSGWTGEGKNYVGEPKQPQEPPYFGVNWTAGSNAVAIPPGGLSGEFDIRIMDDDNMHNVVVWVTYEQADGTPGSCPYSTTTFHQTRDTSESPWRTGKTDRPTTTRVEIGPEGGTMGVGSSASVTVPPGAVPVATCFYGCTLSDSFLKGVGGAVDGGKIRQAVFLGHGALPGPILMPIRVTLSYADLPSLKNPRAYLYNAAENNWEKVEEAQVDPDLKQVKLETTHLSIWGVGGDPAPVGGVAELPDMADGGATLYALWAAVTLVAAAMLCGVWYLARRQRTR